MRRFVIGLLVWGAPAFAGTTVVPGAGEFGAYLFEDLHPCEGDLDYNDAVIRYQAEVVDSGGGAPVTTSVAVSLQVQALGASKCGGLGLRIPAPLASVAQVGIRTGSAASSDGAPWTSRTVLTSGVDYTTDPQGTTLWLVDDLRAWCGGAAGYLNTEAAAPIQACDRVEVTVLFDSDPGFDAGDAPFDVFLHACGDRSRQVHLPWFGPTVEGAADPALGTCDSDPSDPYVHRGRPGTGALAGLPFALHVGEDLSAHPRERVAITTAWPSIIDFAASGGLLGTRYWDDASVDPGAVLSEGAGGVPLPTPARGPVRDGSDAAHAAVDCVDVDDHRIDPYNAAYWVLSEGLLDGAPAADACLFDRHKVEFETPTSATAWSIPAGVGYLTVKAWGAGGGGGQNGVNHSMGGGSGGFTEAVVDVGGLTAIQVVVGGGGLAPIGSYDGNVSGFPPTGNGSFTTPAIGGGGPGAPGSYGHWGRAGGGGGGGLSGVFAAAPAAGTALVIAGGGGGAGVANVQTTPAPGGPGGGAVGGAPAQCQGGSAWTGGGGQTNTGGVSANGTSGTVLSGWTRDGTALFGGSGVVVANMAPYACCGGYYGRGGGGGGGGGWYGGAGGGTSSTTTNGCGGGGGSGYVNVEQTLSGTMTAAAANPCTVDECPSAEPAGTDDPDWEAGFGKGSTGAAQGGRVVVRY